MPGRCFWILAASLSLTAAMAAEPPAGTPDRRATFEYDSIVVSENGHVAVATNGRLETANAFLSAKMIRRDDRTGLILAEGDVVYTTKELRILGARIIIDTRADVIARSSEQDRWAAEIKLQQVRVLMIYSWTRLIL